MGWQLSRYDRFFSYDRGLYPPGSASINESCFIRKGLSCGKMFGASKSCFIACPSDKKLNPILELMEEKLMKLGIEASIATRNRAYGQDIFCTKICGKIIESRFCIVILDDKVKKGTFVPNPNVYFEYGLMTSLRKHIIPLQKEKLKLAFNIQSHDTIKYSLENIAAELERAIRDAVRITEANDPEKARGSLADLGILRKMELAGFSLKGDKWFLSDVIEDTGFKGFGHDERGFYAYVGKMDTQADIRRYIDDLEIVIYRTERKVIGAATEIISLVNEAKSFQDILAKPPQSMSVIMALNALPEPDYERDRLLRSIRSTNEKIEELSRRLDLMKIIYFGFFVSPYVNIDKFLEAANKKVKAHSRYRIICSQAQKLQFGDICVDHHETQD